MPNFQSFRMVMALRTPVVLTDFPPTLDALVYEALSQRSPASSRDDLLLELRDYLAFSEQFGVFHASAMRFGVTMDCGLMTGSYVRTDRHTDDKLSSAMFAPNGAKGRYARINLLGGPTKNRLREMPAYRAPFAFFDGHGDPWAIKGLLEFFVIGLGYDAQNSQMGAFGEIVIAPLSEDSSLLLQGKANRPLPAASGVEGIPGQSPLIPPYYLKNEKQTVVAPLRVRSEMLNTLI
ncbi:TPA: hypothetical protein QHB43_003284 [Aeromonas hydrophila subsp. hydrophila]|nr:hypothetical protein [Aeromonas hydrophila subsp. hydrophila]